MHRRDDALPKIFLRAMAIGVVGVAIATTTSAADTKRPTTYADDIRPIFRRYCYECHSSEKATSGLALDSFAAIEKGGATGAVVVPKNVEGSRLWLLVSHEEAPTMPPDSDRMPKKSLETIRAWIRDGALNRRPSE